MRTNNNVKDPLAGMVLKFFIKEKEAIILHSRLKSVSPSEYIRERVLSDPEFDTTFSDLDFYKSKLDFFFYHYNEERSKYFNNNAGFFLNTYKEFKKFGFFDKKLYFFRIVILSFFNPKITKYNTNDPYEMYKLINNKKEFSDYFKEIAFRILLDKRFELDAFEPKRVKECSVDCDQLSIMHYSRPSLADKEKIYSKMGFNLFFQQNFSWDDCCDYDRITDLFKLAEAENVFNETDYEVKKTNSFIKPNESDIPSFIGDSLDKKEVNTETNKNDIGPNDLPFPDISFDNLGF